MMKKRTLNEIRQVKDNVYEPRLDLAKEYIDRMWMANRTIDELMDKYPNDIDLGREIRKLKTKR
tara:strand:- start:357 stop:548 length:192 start_codon:yes stop_codon:yes gene_type:complete